ncbi:MAG: Fic family protein [candidate division Zixibacteria bacterium]|nr:Fic family protein [candidate division Zixibacteria bacterium]
MPLSKDKILQFDLLDDVDLDRAIELFRPINRISGLLTLVTEMPSSPRVPAVIFRNELKRAVGSTTAIEGNTLTENEIAAAFEKSDKGQTLNRLEQENQNIRNVYEFLVDQTSADGPTEMSVGFLRQMHTFITRDLPDPSNKPGQLRTGQVHFGVPLLPSLFPDQAGVETAVDGFVKWYNSSQQGLGGDPFLKALMSHYYISEIHPFFDGNGRTARALEAYCLLTEARMPSQFFFLLSNYWYGNRDQYLQELRNVRSTGSVAEFVGFGLTGVQKEMDYIRDRIVIKTSQLMFKDYVHYLYREKKKRPHRLIRRMVNVLELLVEDEPQPLKKFMSSPPVRALYSGVDSSTRSRHLKRLQENNLVLISGKRGAETIEANIGILRGVAYNV